MREYTHINMITDFFIQYFWTLQILILIVIALSAVVHFSSNQKNSLFKLKEYERWKNKQIPIEDELAQARMKKKKPLELSGIRLDEPPHKILGVAWNASPNEIEKAFKEKMKHYHPDKVAQPGTQQWNDAQKIAQTLIEARKMLLDRASKKTT